MGRAAGRKQTALERELKQALLDALLSISQLALASRHDPEAGLTCLHCILAERVVTLSQPLRRYEREFADLVAAFAREHPERFAELTSAVADQVAAQEVPA